MKGLTESEKWLMEQARAGLLTARGSSNANSEEILRFTKCFWPFMEKYLSPLHPIYSFEIGDVETFNSESLWLLRDGAIPLAWFFESASEEMSANRRIIVHASLSPIVPKQWRKRTEYFELASSEYFNLDNPPEKLFLTGPVQITTTNVEELEEILDQAVALLDLSKLKEVMLYCPVRRVEHGGGDEENFEFQYFDQIARRFGKRVRFINWNMIQQANFKGTAVVDLNAGWLSKDSSVVHHALSRGGGLLQKPPNPIVGQTYVALSRNHGITVLPSSAEGEFQLAKNAEDLLSFYTSLHKKASNSSNRFPWPKWFHGFTRAAYKRSIARAPSKN